jgi:hypothetical protein
MVVVGKVLVWNVGNFRREHFMAEVAMAGCGDNPGIVQDAYYNNHFLEGDNQIMGQLISEYSIEEARYIMWSIGQQSSRWQKMPSC